jgi:hypothetical protein
MQKRVRCKQRKQQNRNIKPNAKFNYSKSISVFMISFRVNAVFFVLVQSESISVSSPLRTTIKVKKNLEKKSLISLSVKLNLVVVYISCIGF